LQLVVIACAQMTRDRARERRAEVGARQRRQTMVCTGQRRSACGMQRGCARRPVRRDGSVASGPLTLVRPIVPSGGEAAREAVSMPWPLHARMPGASARIQRPSQRSEGLQKRSIDRAARRDARELESDRQMIRNKASSL
jgi:hypothetical protein